MDVTHANFSAIEGEIISSLQSCEFYAMDQEMTGIQDPSSAGEHILDDLATAYPAKRDAASRYTAFQIGLCTFHRGEDGGYTARPFNFWLRPRGNGTDDVSLSMSAMDFLLANHMNFQRFLEEGLPYANAARDAQLQRRFSLTPPAALNQDEVAWVESTHRRIREALATSDATIWEDETPHVSVAADLSLWSTLMENGPWVKSTPSLVGRIYPDKRGPKTVYERVDTLQTMEEISRKEESQLRVQWCSARGFRSIWDTLLALKTTPMIGHNFSSDLMFLLAMHHGPLPETYAEFKALTHSLFPRLFDTKVLATDLPDEPFVNTSLGPLFDATSEFSKSIFRLPMGFESYNAAVMKKNSRYRSAAAAHQGAYDAYMTGIVYARMVSKFGEAAVAPLENRIAVFGNVFCMHFGQLEDRFAFSGAFIVSAPVEWSRSMVEDLLRSAEEREMRQNKKLPPFFSLRSVPGRHRQWVLLLARGQEGRLERFHERIRTGSIAISVAPWTKRDSVN